MKKFALLAIGLLLLSLAAAAQQIQGDYIETRSADVYTGECFANGEMNLVGNEAILGWHVAKGSWNGVALDDSSIVAVVRAKGTLGDPYEDPYPAKAVLIVDQQTTPAQRQALQAFAHHMGGKLLDNVEQVIVAPVDLVVNHQKHGNAVLRAGQFATVQTRSLNDTDHVCGNEKTYYPPLTDTTHAMPAVAMTNQYSGPNLGETWSIHEKRSAFVGSFGVSGTAITAGE